MEQQATLMAMLSSKEFAQVYVALLWIAFWSILIYKFRHHIGPVVTAFVDRIHSGSSVSLFGFNLGEPPGQLRNSAPGSAAVFDPEPAAVVSDVVEDMAGHYSKLKNEDYFLIHAAEVVQPRTAPRSGRYRVRIWVESFTDKPLDIARVTYQLLDYFTPPIIATTSIQTNFDVWLTVYGEFPVMAKIDRKDHSSVYVSRYIDLPGRPPD